MGIKVHINPDVLVQTLSEGHELGNHVWNHPVLSRLSFQDVSLQINRTAQAIQVVTNYTPRIMRYVCSHISCL
jgi:peptidoglycan/xylan/chitin deacetylase (PgdA/CDA1 family)